MFAAPKLACCCRLNVPIAPVDMLKVPPEASDIVAPAEPALDVPAARVPEPGSAVNVPVPDTEIDPLPIDPPGDKISDPGPIEMAVAPIEPLVPSLTRNLPPVIVVAPVKVLAPDNIQLPFETAKASLEPAVPSPITPLIVLGPLFAPDSVNVVVPLLAPEVILPPKLSVAVLVVEPLVNA